MNPLEVILVAHLQEHLTTEQMTPLLLALREREDEIADQIRGAAVAYGAYPQITAFVLTEVGLGTPVSEAERTMIREQYNLLIQQLTAEQ